MGGSDEEAVLRQLAWTRASERPRALAMDSSYLVLPLFDFNRAVIELRVNGTWRSFHVTDAQAVKRALENAVGRPCWHEATKSLLVRSPEHRNSTGYTHSFSLVEFSEARQDAKVVR